MRKLIKVFCLILMIFSFMVPISSLALSEEQVKASGKKGDIYNPQTNSIGDSAVINAHKYQNGKTYSNGDVEVKKIVSKTNDEGKYKVEFKIRGKNATEGIESVNPVYVVVVLDASNSMYKQNKWENAKKGVEEFSTQLLKNIPTAQIALVKFAGRSINDNWSDAEVKRFFKNEKITASSIGEIKVNGGGATNLGEGLRQAYRLLNNQKVPSDNSTLYADSNYASVPSNAKKYVVVLSDGVPTLYTLDNGKSFASKESDYAKRYCKYAYASAVNWANKLKDELKADIITIGYELDKIEWTKDRNKAYELLENIASKDSFVIKDTYITDIVNNFKNVTTKIEVEFNAGSDVVITDNLGSAFTLKNGNSTLKLDTITSDWNSLGTFNITIDKDSSKGWYPTNDGFKVTYKDYKGRVKEIVCNDDPEVLWEQAKYEYKVNYYFNNKFDSSFTRILDGVLKSIVYAKDNYLEEVNSLGLKIKNNSDDTNYFLDPNNSSNSSNITISSILDNNILNIYYIDTSFGIEKIDKNTNVKTIKEESLVIPYTIDYSVDINNIRKGDKVTTTIVDTLPYEIDIEKSALNGGIYDKETKTITWNFEETMDEFQEKRKISKKIEYSVVYKDFAEISSSDANGLINIVNGFTKVNDQKTDGVDDSESIEVLIEGNVKAIYVEEGAESNKLADDSNLKGLVGKDYNTSAKDIFGYTLVEEKFPTNSKGKFVEDEIIVKYLYKKNVGSIINSIKKESKESVNSINDVFDYKITVDADIKDYIGNVKLKVIDTLPYKINKNKSILDDRCKYDGDLQIICEIDYGEIKKDDYEINKLEERIFNIHEIFGFKLSFVDIGSEVIINKVSSEVILDSNNDIKVDSVETSIPRGNVIVHYVTKENKKLAESIVINGLVGTDYETIKKDFGKYSFVEVIGDVKGQIQKGTTEVTYVYDLTELPPHTGTNKSNDIYVMKYVLYFVLGLIVLRMIKNLYLKLIKK